MKLSDREKVTVLVGVCVVAATVLIAAIVSPLAGRWHQLGSQLRPELKTVKQLMQRAEKRDNLLSSGIKYFCCHNFRLAQCERNDGRRIKRIGIVL